MAEILRLDYTDYSLPGRGLEIDGPATLPIGGLIVPDSCPLVGGWMRQSNVYVHCMKPKYRDEHKQDDGETTVFEVDWESAKWSPITRKLVNQSHRYFMSLQEAGCKEVGGVEGAELVQYSRYYRSALHECVVALKKKAEESDSREERDSLTQQSYLYSMMELAWHLCEVIFIEVLPPGCLVQQLLEWICWHSGGAEEEAVHALLATPRPEDDPAYWRTLTWLLLKGKLNEVRNLLSHHSKAHSLPHVFGNMDELLRKAPMVYSTASRSRSELHRQWQEWRSECIRWRDSADFIGIPWLQKVVRILCGDDVLYDPEIMECCSHWYELLVGVLLYRQPLVVSTDYDLTFTAEEVRKQFPFDPDDGSHGNGEGALDEILMATLRNDIMDVIKVSSSYMSNWWFVAHLTNLMGHREKVEQRINPEFKGPLMTASFQHKYGTELSEFLLLEYGTTLLGHESLWQVAMDYFSACPSKGKDYMKLCLERVPLETERKAVKVLRVCEQYQLIDTARGICKVLAMRAYKNGRPGVAFSWCIRGKDCAFAGFLAEKYFENYKNEGEFLDLDLLDHLGDTILMNERLMFLAKYREYHQLFEKGEVVAAGKLLVSLLTSNTVPKKFWSTLLTDALQLCEREELVFSTEHTNALSHVVQELILSPPDPDTSGPLNPTTASLLDQERTELLQLALARNLCRSMLEEHSL